MANYKNLEQVLDLVHRTGDKVVVVSEHHDPYVIMPVKEYEALLHSSSPVKHLSEDELLEKINRDIAVWKASQQENGADYSAYDLDNFRAETPQNKPNTPLPPQAILHPEPLELESAPAEDKYYLEPAD